MRWISAGAALCLIALSASIALAATEPEVCTKENYGRGAGSPLSSCGAGQEKGGALCYPECREGYRSDGATLCYRRCPKGTKYSPGFCHYKLGSVGKCKAKGLKGLKPACMNVDSYSRGVGKPFGCHSAEDEDGALCYPGCRSGHDGVGPVCWERCPKDFPVSCGASCATSKGECAAPLRAHMNSCTEPKSATACNGSPTLCDKRYDEVVFAGTHNSFAVLGGTAHLAPANHAKNVTWQLRHGIRGLMLDIYEHNGKVHVCHGGCGLGDWGTLHSVLRSVRRFLDANSSETITIIFEPYVSNAKAWAVFKKAGLADRVYERPDSATPWPTLQDLRGKVLVFSTKAKDPSTRIMHYWTHAFETPYSFALPKDLDGPGTCKVDRGTGSGLFVLNHFTTPPSAGIGRINNSEKKILKRVEVCRKVHGRHPSFVFVDFAEEGDVLEAVRALNGS